MSEVEQEQPQQQEPAEESNGAAGEPQVEVAGENGAEAAQQEVTPVVKKGRGRPRTG